MRIFWFCLSVLMSCFVQANTVFEVNYLTEESNRDAYYRELIKVALEKTTSTYGDYRLNMVDNVPTQRRFAYAQQNLLPNVIVLRGFDEHFYKSGRWQFVAFPMDLGALGIRVCFVSPSKKQEISQVDELEKLTKYTIVQGIGWADNKILRDNGFRVVELDGYENLFKMVASGRADLFCRGFNELTREYKERLKMENLVYDNSFILRYNMPYFLFTHLDNVLLKRRLEEGLKLAYKDGTVMKLWMKEYGNSAEFVNLSHRRIFNAKNSFLSSISNDYEAYLLDVYKESSVNACDKSASSKPCK